ncbi:hypothetical protein [Pseudomonas frederiksbergensis]|jgi:hypothetical protein|uniref:Uncharacterized protein n=1 Tax=Pseudomonas frederiksbergensis TaxID=104087 RepID=A0A0B1Z564_9PSED|nr:hypothetical protein [Pseudomonas frederiksbergensis]KHK65730.1 hypothetical protein JZ00_07595 [Pseudomonas frederiksbergensis]WRV66038.1 hypothetical protein VQ575_14135 [Pseudomonas frederiksbergensis]
MSYPKDTPYRGYIIREHDPAYQAYSFQGFDTSGNSITMLCETAQHVKELINKMLDQPDDGRF